MTFMNFMMMREGSGIFRGILLLTGGCDEDATVKRGNTTADYLGSKKGGGLGGYRYL